MRIHLPTVVASVVASCLVALAVSPAADFKPESTPSQADRLSALSMRVDALQNREAFTRRIAGSALTLAQDARNKTACMDGVWFKDDPVNGDLTNDDGTDETAILLAEFNPACVTP